MVICIAVQTEPCLRNENINNSIIFAPTSKCLDKALKISIFQNDFSCLNIFKLKQNVTISVPHDHQTKMAAAFMFI